MCFLCLLSSSRWPGGYPARCSEECTDKLRSGSYIPLNPLSASPIFVTVFVALRIHKKDFCWQTFFWGGGYFWGFFFSETTMKTVRGVENHWLKKTKHAQCWPQGETFEACRVQMDSLAQHVLSNFERLRQVLVLCLIIFLSKDDSIFLERLSSPWFVLFGAPPSNRPLWRNSCKREERSWRGTWSGWRTIRSYDTKLTNFEFYTDMGDRESAFKETRKEENKK